MNFKDSHETKFNPPELHEFLTKNNLGLTFTMLSNSLTNYTGRTKLLKEKCDLLKNILTSPLPGPADKNLLYDISKIHCQQLDLLSSIFMFLEDFLAHSYHLKESLSKLQEYPALIVSENYDVKQEIGNLRGKRVSDIKEYLLFPDAELIPVSEKERNLLRIVFDRMASDIHKRIKNIIEFYDNYYRVYIKYKHVLTAIIGLHEIIVNPADPLKKTVASHVYIRDRFKDQYRTHIIACNLETISYYEQIFKDIRSVFELLMISYLHYLMNYGKRVVIPIGTYIEEEEKEQWASI